MPEKSNINNNILSGLKVLDLTQFLAGPYGTQILGDLGATIIKVEPPGRGDQSRRLAEHSYKGESAYYLSINRNKYGIGLNVKSERGYKILLELVKKVDVVIDNFRPGVMERLGLSYERLKEVNPGVIYCGITGFGKNGPYKERPAYDMIVQAISGGMSMTGEEGGRPVRAGLPIGDVCAGMYAVMAILAALYERSKSGLGQEIDISMLDVQVAMLCYQGVYHLLSGYVPGAQGRGHVSIPTYRAFETMDGQELVIAANTEAMWAGLCRVLNLEHLIDDPRFKTLGDRLKNKLELWPLLEGAFKQKNRDEWLNKLLVAGIPSAPINTVKQALADPQVLEREMVINVNHSLGGKVKLLGNPIKFSRTPANIFKSPPVKGEHTDEILREYLGYDSKTLSDLRNMDVIE